MSHISFSDLSAHINTEITIRGYVDSIRDQKKMYFVVLRHITQTIQVVFFKKALSEKTLSCIQELTAESVIDVHGTVKNVPNPVKSTTIHDLEIGGNDVTLISAAVTPLPFELLSAKKRDCNEDENIPSVHQDTRLDFRYIDLRTPANQAIFRVQTEIQRLFREFVIEKDFVEIHTPKIISTASEGGADVFAVKYFDQTAYLAQSPQLYKQMCICSGFDRVFEIGSVFRAEKSFTKRHLTEFVGIDLEMTFVNDYHEVLEFFMDLFCHIFAGLEKNKWISLVKQQFPAKDITYKRCIITFPEAVTLLREHGYEQDDFSDLSTESERALGVIVKEKYGTDFFVLDKFPSAARPFYTMVDPDDARYSNSYDIFLRGQEIMSGAQRINDAHVLEQRATDLGVDLEPISSYVDCFKYGAPPHAGGGIGLERITMLYLGLTSVKQTSLFPRDPSRLNP